MEQIQNSLLEFVDSESNNDELFQNLIKIIDENQITGNKYAFKSLLYIISSIANDHHRTSSFFSKIEQILLNYKEIIKSTFSNHEIFEICQVNKRLLLFFIKEDMLTISVKISDILFDKYIYTTIPQYLCIELKPFVRFNLTVPDNFEETRKNYENENIICELIRNDSIDDFIIYVHENNIDLNSLIKVSAIETNSYLIKNEPTLIEYAAFFGSIKIFQYMIKNNVELTSSIWIYAIHGNNAEIINFIEEAKIKPPENSYEICFEEAIKCYHNDIADYIQINYLNSPNSIQFGLNHYNFSYIQENLIDVSVLLELIDKEYNVIIENLLKNPGFDINHRFVV